MAERATERWNEGDDITAVRLEMMRVLSESAQLTAIGENVHLHRGAEGGTAIAVDEVPRRGGGGDTRSVLITSQIAAGRYYGSCWQNALETAAADEAAPLTAVELQAAGDDCIIWDGGQAASGVAVLPLVGVNTIGRIVGYNEDPGEETDGWPVIQIATPPILKYRFNTAGTKFQGSFLLNPSTDADWVDLMDATPGCSTE